MKNAFFTEKLLHFRENRVILIAEKGAYEGAHMKGRFSPMQKIERLGVQLYTIRDFLNSEEFIKTSFEKLKKLGYDEVQTAGCKIDYETFGRLAREAGLTIVGTHSNFAEMCADPELAMQNHDALNTKIMGIGGFFKTTAADYLDFIGQANEFAAKVGLKGYKFTYHNHSHEFIHLPKEGGGYTTAMELLYEQLNPTYTSFVLDTYWVQHGGADIRYWIEKLTGRIDILHLKDMGRAEKTAPSHCFITEIGQGNIWWEGVIESAIKAGVKSYVVEQDTCPGDPFASLKISSDYIHANFM